MKRVFWTVLILFLVQPVMGVTLTGGVVYTVESARRAAFDGIEYEISMEPYRGYMVDPGFIAAGGEGKRAKVSRRGRNITWFSDGGYCVRYYDDWGKIFYYFLNGELENIEFRDISFYPALTLKYDGGGDISEVVYFISSRESYIYDKNKILLGHWIGNKCYDENGKIINKRK